MHHFTDVLIQASSEEVLVTSVFCPLDNAHCAANTGDTSSLLPKDRLINC